MIIVEVGSLNMDLVMRMPAIPKPGETLLGGEFHTYPGGKGANQAVAAARLGAQVYMVGSVGEDQFGVELRAILQAEGVDTTHVNTCPGLSTGVALIQVDSSAQNSIALAQGANFSLSSMHVESALKAIGQFDAVILSLEVPIEPLLTAARIAARQGALVILNPAPAQVLPSDLLSVVDILVPNEHEIALLADMKVESETALYQAATRLHAQGLKHLVITLGNRGCIYTCGMTDEKHTIPAPVVQAVDTTAAGDCFIGALTVALCDGRIMADALRYASAAAAISVTRLGAQPSLPFRDEVERFFDERTIQ